MMKKKILIIEDDQAHRHMLQTSLIELDVEVLSTDNGQVGLEILLTEPDIDLVVTNDVIPFPGHIPVVFLSGHRENVSFTEEPVPQIILTKPVMPDDFKNIVENIIFK